MKTKFASLLAGLALLGLAGTAQADALTATKTSAPSQVVKLSDAQLDDVTAGFWQGIGYWTFGFYYGGHFYSYYTYLWLWR